MTDWPKLIAELETVMTISKIALMCECQYIQIQRFKEGAEPRHALGERILEVHENYIRNTRADVPVS